MSGERASPTTAVRELLADAVDSFEKLEIAVHVYRAQSAPQQTTAIATALALPFDTTAEALVQLQQARIVETANHGPQQWKFDATGPWTGAMAELVALYERDRFEVLNIIAKMAIERVRSRAARMLADAFIVRAKKKPKGEPDA